MSKDTNTPNQRRRRIVSYVSKVTSETEEEYTGEKRREVDFNGIHANDDSNMDSHWKPEADMDNDSSSSSMESGYKHFSDDESYKTVNNTIL